METQEQIILLREAIIQLIQAEKDTGLLDLIYKLLLCGG